MITEPLTKEERERRLKHKTKQLQYGRLLAEAFDKGQLRETLETLNGASNNPRHIELEAHSQQRNPMLY